MRILQICKKFPFPPKDGETIAIYNLTKTFFQLGHEVTVLSINTQKHHFNPDQLPPEARKVARFIAVDVDTRIKTTNAFFNLFSTKSYNIERFNDKKFHKAITDYLTANEVDVVQLEGLYLAPYLKTIKKATKAPVVLRAHNLEYEIWERMAASEKGWKHQYFSLLAARLKKYELSEVNNFDALVPISSADEEKFRNFGADLPIKTIPAGVDLSLYKPDPSKAEIPSLFFLGGLDWLPNQEGLKWFLDEVWPKVYHINPYLTFYIAGRNAPEWLRNLKKMNVKVIGEVENAVDFYNSKYINVVPLLSGSGIRIKLLEAMAMQKAVVATSVAAEGIPVTNGEEMMIADTPDSFAGAIQRLLSSRAQCEQMGKAGRDLVKQHFEQKALAKKLVDFYKNLSA